MARMEVLSPQSAGNPDLDAEDGGQKKSDLSPFDPICPVLIADTGSHA